MQTRSRSRSQCIVVRNSKILMARHRQNGEEWRCLPGGAVESGETPEEAALRELLEESCVNGMIVRKTSEYQDPFEHNGQCYTFLVDIGHQEPVLGEDPEIKDNPILFGIDWLSLNEICERDRAFFVGRRQACFVDGAFAYVKRGRIQNRGCGLEVL